MLLLSMHESQGHLINDLKKRVFHDLLEIAGRVFIVVRYSENVSVGRRGFTDEEKENGLVLVMNSQMNFRWKEEGIDVRLMFGGAPEKCFIPADDIIAVYSPEAHAQFLVAPPEIEEKPAGKTEKERQLRRVPEKENDKVVKVDFRKKKK
ncbi:stringent starvation protein B [bacterium BMS3Abin07]|nr:stringent starvation protein B [bacterium BMS3Abin07]GBE32770.1 stringent starvation protein B [bacterium BMS3Bbin05]HDL21316.1 hypothetical protein [Nitrospirota bacterium]HDO22379.1 hypothetical protein [Nitrospirota bacterium]HDZ87578.1 hypothetical protein [Nitrospirota bacterium]